MVLTTLSSYSSDQMNQPIGQLALWVSSAARTFQNLVALGKNHIDLQAIPSISATFQESFFVNNIITQRLILDKRGKSWWFTILFLVLCENHMGFHAFSKPPSIKPINQHYLNITWKLVQRSRPIALQFHQMTVELNLWLNVNANVWWIPAWLWLPEWLGLGGSYVWPWPRACCEAAWRW